MRQQHTLGIISGTHESPAASVNLKSSWNFSTVGAQASDVVENKTQGTSGSVVSVVDANTLQTDINFQQGDFFELTLSSDWRAATNLGPVYELVCRLCGFACTREELDTYDGRCKTCYDEPHPADAVAE